MSKEKAMLEICDEFSNSIEEYRRARIIYNTLKSDYLNAKNRMIRLSKPNFTKLDIIFKKICVKIKENSGIGVYFSRSYLTNNSCKILFVDTKTSNIIGTLIFIYSPECFKLIGLNKEFLTVSGGMTYKWLAEFSIEFQEKIKGIKNYNGVINLINKYIEGQDIIIKNLNTNNSVDYDVYDDTEEGDDYSNEND